MITNNEVSTTSGYTDVGAYRIRYTIVSDSTQERVDAAIVNLNTEQSLGYVNIHKVGAMYVNIYDKGNLSLDDRILILDTIMNDAKGVFTTE